MPHSEGSPFDGIIDHTLEQLREHIAREIEALDLNPFDCCGCSTYEDIRDACAAIARGDYEAHEAALQVRETEGDAEDD